MNPRVKTGAGSFLTSLDSRAVSRRTEIFVAEEISSRDTSRMSLSRRSSSPNVRIGVSPIRFSPDCGSLMLDLRGPLRKDSFRAGPEQQGPSWRITNSPKIVEARPGKQGQRERVRQVRAPEH